MHIWCHNRKCITENSIVIPFCNENMKTVMFKNISCKININYTNVSCLKQVKLQNLGIVNKDNI